MTALLYSCGELFASNTYSFGSLAITRYLSDIQVSKRGEKRRISTVRLRMRWAIQKKKLTGEDHVES